jgi:hypothetical protein
MHLSSKLAVFLTPHFHCVKERGVGAAAFVILPGLNIGTAGGRRRGPPAGPDPTPGQKPPFRGLGGPKPETRPFWPPQPPEPEKPPFLPLQDPSRTPPETPLRGPKTAKKGSKTGPKRAFFGRKNTLKKGPNSCNVFEKNRFFDLQCP